MSFRGNFMKKTDSNIFWDKITNATGFIDLISNKLRKHSLILTSSKDIPWYDYFRDQIAKKIKKYNKSSMYIIDGKKYKDKFEDEYEFNDFLAEEYCSYDMRLECDSSTNLPKFMAEHNDGISIHKKYIWIDIYSQKSFENWINFISKYVEYREKYIEGKDNKETACFLIACHDNYASESKLDSYSFSGKIESYDYFVFCNLILSNFNILSDLCLSDYDLKDNIEEAEKDIKTYIAEFVSNIIKDKYGKNIELIAECLNEKNYKAFLNNPSVYIKKKNITIDLAIENVLLKSQVKILFPILEEFRQKVVDNYSNLIEEFIPKLNEQRKIRAGNKPYTSIEDVMDCELKDFGELLIICNSKSNKIEDCKYNDISQLEKKLNIILGEVYKNYQRDFEQRFEAFKRIICRDEYSNLIEECISRLNEERKNKPYKSLIKDIMDLKFEDLKKIKFNSKNFKSEQLKKKIDMFLRMNNKGDNKGYIFTLIEYYVNIRNILAHGNRDELLSFIDVKHIICLIRLIPVEVIMHYCEKYSICKKLGLL